MAGCEDGGMRANGTREGLWRWQWRDTRLCISGAQWCWFMMLIYDVDLWCWSMMLIGELICKATAPRQSDLWTWSFGLPLWNSAIEDNYFGGCFPFRFLPAEQEAPDWPIGLLAPEGPLFHFTDALSNARTLGPCFIDWVGLWCWACVVGEMRMGARRPELWTH